MEHSDYDPPEFYNRNFAKGRKEYRCEECLRTIGKGEVQEVVSGKWNGHFSCFRTCMRCVDLREAVNPNGCFIHGHLMDECSQVDEITEDMNQFLSERRENWARLDKERKAKGTP